CHLRDMRLYNVANGGISLTDTNGAAYYKLSDIYVIGAPVMGATSVAIQCALQSTIEINQVSFNGGGSTWVQTGCFTTGIQIVSGGHIISDVQAETVSTAVDIAATASEYPQIIDRMVVTNTSVGTPRGIWIHSGFTGHALFRGITSGAGIIGIQNDNTGYKSPSGSAAVVPSYISSGTPADVSIHEGVISSG